MKKFLLVGLMVSCAALAGCAALFGGKVPLIDASGKQVLNPDGTPAMVWKEGALPKLVKAISPVADIVPYGKAGAAILAIIAGIGVGVQEARVRKQIKPDALRRMVEGLKPLVKDLRDDEDLGDLVARWEPDSDVSKKIKAAWLKHRTATTLPDDA